MTWLENLNVNIFSMLLVLVVLMNNELRHHSTGNSRLFNLVIVQELLLMLADIMGTAAAQHFAGEVSRIVWFFNISGLLFRVGVTAAWFGYVCCVLYGDGRKVRMNVLGIAPFIVMVVAALALLFVPYEHFGGYGVKNAGYVMRICYRGVAFMGAGMFIGSALVAEYVRRHERTREVRQECMYLGVFSILAAVGTLMQNFFPQFKSASPCIALAILYVYISTQNRQVITDSLTGVNNRRELESYIERRSRQSGSGDWGLLMIDVDDFKVINDNAGHKQGDDALWNVADILKSIFDGKDDFIARFGGDEFVVCGEWESHECLEDKIRDINKKISEFNNQKERQYKLSLSMGGALWSESGRERDGIIEAADRRMYENKLEKKKPGGAGHECGCIYPD